MGLWMEGEGGNNPPIHTPSPGLTVSAAVRAGMGNGRGRDLLQD